MRQRIGHIYQLWLMQRIGRIRELRLREKYGGKGEVEG